MITSSEFLGQKVIRMPTMRATAPLTPRVVRTVLIADFDSSAESSENAAKTVLEDCGEDMRCPF